MPYKDIEKQRKYQREWSRKNRNRIKTSIKTRRTLWLTDYKRTLRCRRCGFKFDEFPEVCEFHHVEPLMKMKGSPQQLAHNGSWISLYRELSVCILLCANCHRIIHHIV